MFIFYGWLISNLNIWPHKEYNVWTAGEGRKKKPSENVLGKSERDKSEIC